MSLQCRGLCIFERFSLRSWLDVSNRGFLTDGDRGCDLYLAFGVIGPLTRRSALNFNN